MPKLKGALKMKNAIKFTFLLLVVLLLSLTGCGGSGGSGTSGIGVSAVTVSGVAATGTPITGTVNLKDSSTPAKELSLPINSDGSFSFDVTGLTAPFILKAVGGANGQNYTLYSFAGAPGVANINPLSHLAVVQANGGTEPAALYSAPTVTQMQAIKAASATSITQVQTLFQQMLSQYGADSINFISDKYSANHTGLDLMFDTVAITVTNGNLTVTNKVSGASIFTAALGGSPLSGQINTANIPVIATQTAGSVYIYPTTSSVATGGTVTFNAIVMGMADQSVSWSVVDAGGGSINSSGVYTAPSIAGTYNVQAISTADTSKKATAAVTVTPPPTTPTTGLMGGAIQGKSLQLSITVSTLAGSPSAFGSTDGIGSTARFNWPESIATDGANLYVSDFVNNTIRKIVISTGAVTTIAGTAGISGTVDGIGAAARFNFLRGITTDGTNLYVTDSGTVRKIVISTSNVSTIADFTSFIPRYGLGGITTDGTNLYVTGHNVIRKIIIATGSVSILAGSVNAAGFIDGIGTGAKFNSITDITTDGTNLYVIDNSTVRKIVIATGAVTTIAGAPGVSVSTDGTGSAARLYAPTAITSDGTNLYLTDYADNVIRKIAIASGQVTTIAGVVGSRLYVDGAGSAARFFSPFGITTDGNNLFITERDSLTSTSTIRMMH